LKGKLAVGDDPDAVRSVRANDTEISLSKASVDATTQDDWTDWNASVDSPLRAELKNFRFALVGSELFEVKELSLGGARKLMQLKG